MIFLMLIHGLQIKLNNLFNGYYIIKWFEQCKMVLRFLL